MPARSGRRITIGNAAFLILIFSLWSSASGQQPARLSADSNSLAHQLHVMTVLRLLVLLNLKRSRRLTALRASHDPVASKRCTAGDVDFTSKGPAFRQTHLFLEYLSPVCVFNGDLQRTGYNPVSAFALLP